MKYNITQWKQRRQRDNFGTNQHPILYYRRRHAAVTYITRPIDKWLLNSCIQRCISLHNMLGLYSKGGGMNMGRRCLNTVLLLSLYPDLWALSYIYAGVSSYGLWVSATDQRSCVLSYDNLPAQVDNYFILPAAWLGCIWDRANDIKQVCT